MREELLKIASKIDKLDNKSYLKNNDGLMNDFIQNNMDYKSIIDNMDIIMRYTSNNNKDYFSNKKLVGNVDFLNAVKNNINNFKYPDNIKKILGFLDDSFDTRQIYTDDFIEKLLDLDLSYVGLRGIASSIPRDKIDLLINICLKKKKYIKELVVISIDEYNSSYFKFLVNNINICAKETDIPFILKDYLKNYDDCVEVINKSIKDNPENAYKSFLFYNFQSLTNDETCYKFIKFVVDELCKNEDVGISDIEFLGNGAYSTVYGIGEKVLKISFTRQTPVFSDNPYIVRPLLRREISNDDFGFFIEVTEKVDTNSFVSDDEMYDLYKKIRNLGLIWVDTFKDNVGRLKKDNIIHWKDDLLPTSNSLNLNDKVGEDVVLKKGDLVLMDADFIYDEDECLYSPNLINKNFENRFQHDLNLTLEIIKNLDTNSKIFKKVVKQRGFRPAYVRYIIEKRKNKIKR